MSKKDSAEWTKSWYFAEALLARALFVQVNYQLKVLSIPLTPELNAYFAWTSHPPFSHCFMYSSTMTMFGNSNGNVNPNGNGQIDACSWLDTYLCCGCLSSDDLSPEPVPDAWCAFIMDFISLTYERSQCSQWPQDVHGMISRYKTEKWQNDKTSSSEAGSSLIPSSTALIPPTGPWPCVTIFTFCNTSAEYQYAINMQWINVRF